MKITRAMVGTVVHEFEVFKFSAEASSLGLPPGTWPKTIETELGNGQPFIRQFINGEASVVYGCISLTVFND